MAPPPAGSALHQQVSRALDRAARAQEDSRALIADYRRARDALEETIGGAHRRRQPPPSGDDGSETDNPMPGSPHQQGRA